MADSVGECIGEAIALETAAVLTGAAIGLVTPVPGGAATGALVGGLTAISPISDHFRECVQSVKESGNDPVLSTDQRQEQIAEYGASAPLESSP